MRVFDYDTTGYPDDYPIAAMFVNPETNLKVEILREIGVKNSKAHCVIQPFPNGDFDVDEEESVECFNFFEALRIAEFICKRGHAPEGSYNPYAWAHISERVINQSTVL